MKWRIYINTLEADLLRMDATAYSGHSIVQHIAKVAMDLTPVCIRYPMQEQVIAEITELNMYYIGQIDKYWYHDVGALVLIGGNSKKSISGRDYKLSKKLLEANDVITIDLSPRMGLIWGDYARTFVIENGKFVQTPRKKSPKIIKKAFRGIETEKALHATLLEVATLEMTFEELYEIMNREIEQAGYINLDFRKNLGHTIETHIDRRIFIEKGNTTPLGEATLFTFEPHITAGEEDPFGYKHEDIYYFYEGELKVL